MISLLIATGLVVTWIAGMIALAWVVCWLAERLLMYLEVRTIVASHVRHRGEFEAWKKEHGHDRHR